MQMIRIYILQIVTKNFSLPKKSTLDYIFTVKVLIYYFYEHINGHVANLILILLTILLLFF